MIFADIPLAARIERAECRLIADCAEAIARRRPDEGVLVTPISSGVAIYTGDGSPLNKVAGLGFAGAVPAGELEAFERACAARGAAVQVELSCLADPSVGGMLTRRGYNLVGFENVLGRTLHDRTWPAAASDLDIRPSGDDELAAWIDVVATGFATPDTQGVPAHEFPQRDVIERIISDMAGAANFARYMVRRGGELAGAASMRLCDGLAQLAGAATLPAHRRRGIQSALLMWRLQEAQRCGCDLATVTTLPGSKSHENVQRRGFELLYTRAVLVRDADEPQAAARGS